MKYDDTVHPKLVYVFKEENFMKLLRVIIPALAICIVQVACLTPMRSYSDTTPIPIDIQIPALAIRDQENSFVIVTEPNITCYAVISFWTLEDHWSATELSIKQADHTGRCEWEWKIPTNARDGVGEFRGYVENDNQRTAFIPKAFCIEECP